MATKQKARRAPAPVSFEFNGFTENRTAVRGGKQFRDLEVRLVIFPRRIEFFGHENPLVPNLRTNATKFFGFHMSQPQFGHHLLCDFPLQKSILRAVGRKAVEIDLSDAVGFVAARLATCRFQQVFQVTAVIGLAEPDK